ncbi:hypothetical protein C8Q76DRAFT_675567 [Earliella scabrosa]|nr:hypothetical protein C8Q76DRAFT_675567 [Earliella scabrosa]
MSDIDAHIDAAIAAVQNSSLTPEAAANEVAARCTQSILYAVASNEHLAQGGDTPGLESFLWFFWEKLLNIAEDDASTHARLAQVLTALKAKGTEGCDGWQIWGARASWARLSLFGPVSREMTNGPQVQVDGQNYPDLREPRAQAILSGDAPSDDPYDRGFAEARKRWLNINAFLATLWALDVVDEDFYAITTMAMQLEPLSTSSTHAPTEATRGIGEPQELQIEIAATWVRIAGAKMFACREILGPKGNPQWRANAGRPGRSGGTWDGVDGFHPERWAHWKQLFAEIAQGTWRESVVQAARGAVEAMNQVEREAVPVPA